MQKFHVPPFEIRLRVLNAIEHAPGACLRARFKYVAGLVFEDQLSGRCYQFTWRTISTWFYRYKLHGVATLENKKRGDKGQPRKLSVSQLAEAIEEVLPVLARNKTGIIPKSVLYRQLLRQGLMTRAQMAPSTFYRLIRENDLLNDEEKASKLRLAFAMQYANELWQADTLFGPSIQQADGRCRKTFLIAFLDDASRVICHAQFFYRDNTENMVLAFRQALYKRSKPQRLYFDNGSNYKSKAIFQACVRLNIQLSHAPVRDGAAKGKIERFFRGFRDRFLTLHREFESLEQLNQLPHEWVENEYNAKHHSGIQMIPVERFNLDRQRIDYLCEDEFSAEVFFVEEARKVSKTNVFSMFAQKFECPVDLRGKTIQVRYDRMAKDSLIVYFNEQRMGKAHPLDVYLNAQSLRLTRGGPHD